MFHCYPKANWLLIGLFPTVLWLKWWLTNSLWSSNDTWLGLLFIGGALLEQINYYYYQLMYDNRYDLTYLRRYRQLHQGNIGKALAQLSAHPTGKQPPEPAAEPFRPNCR